MGELIVLTVSVVHPSSVRRLHSSNIFSSETSVSVKAKFHMEPLWVWQTNVCSCVGGWGLGHMTKVAATPLYGKKALKIFFSGTKGQITLVLGMQHWGLGSSKVCSNNDLGSTLILLLQGQICFHNMLLYGESIHFFRKKCKKVILRKKLTTYDWSHKLFLLTSKFCPQGVVCPCPGLYACIKAWTNMYKIRVQRDFFKLATNGQSDKAFLLTLQLCPKRVVCPCSGAIYMYK